MDNIVTHPSGNRADLRDLRLAHHDLDVNIAELSVIPYTDQLRLRRLKKEKLRLKDMIVKIESAMIPDMNA